ncbi:flagellin, partial [Ectothiorhodospira sp. PHS-1]|uniref:flagellin n=1 Tax=Ectothiorhodospira sp. PHS-1 TaxID=519989 RepID=UPI00024A8418
VQAANGTYTEEDRDIIQIEVDQLADEINRIAEQTTFNGETILDGTFGGGTVTLHVGANSGDTLELELTEDFLAFANAIDVAGADGTTADGAIGDIDDLLVTIGDYRANLGAYQNRLESAVANLMNAAENQSAARSRIRDADFAAETAELTRNQILQQAGVSVLAQANTAPQSVLALLQ